METIRRFEVTEDGAGVRMDKYLSGLVPEFSRSYLQRLIQEERVRVDGRPVRGKEKAVPGTVIELDVPEAVEPRIEPEDLPLKILYEDKDVILVNKPKGMVVHPSAGHSSGTLVNAVMYHCRDSLSGINGTIRPGIVHRIDMDTTGALIVCKNDSAHLHIAEQIKAHSVTRRYLGIVKGIVREDSGTVEGTIGRHPSDRKKMAANPRNGKRAVTHYRVLQRFSSHTYVEFELETGRTHQIRVHMASIGHPLLGDSVYGNGKSPWKLQGQTLHAAVIGFVHPSTGEYVEVSAPLPEYFADLLKKAL